MREGRKPKRWLAGLLFCLAMGCTAVTGKTIYVDDDGPADFNNIQAAINNANDGDTVRVSAGTYNERLVVERSISIVGDDTNNCILTGDGYGPSGGTVVTVSESVYISGFTIHEANIGIFVTSGESLTIENCTIARCWTDGVGFDFSFNTTLFMRNCFIASNGDGVDVASTQGMIISTKFVSNNDDGLDYDGDAGVLVYDCMFTSNADDGIEIRLAMRTHAIILDSIFEENGEDGIEVINSPSDKDIYNLLCVQNCHFGGNTRYGVGFVSHETEEYTGEMSRTAVYAVGNTYVNGGVEDVSPNYTAVFDAPKSYPASVTTWIRRAGETDVVKHLPVQIPLLVGIYNLRPTTDGNKLGDAEAVTVLGNRIHVADDNVIGTAVYVLDKSTGEIVETIPTNPFPGGGFNAPNPEGLDIVTYDDNNALLVLNDLDYCTDLYTLSLEESLFGHVLRHQCSYAFHGEGVERVGDELIVVGDDNLHRVDANTLQEINEHAWIYVNHFGNHFAGVGADETESSVFCTLSGYTNSSQTWRNHKSAFFEMDPALTEIRNLWHLGPFSNDPRGISIANGLFYVADGRSYFTDTETGEVNRGGIKVFVFLLEDDPNVFTQVLPFLPIRCSVSPSPRPAPAADITDDGVVNFKDFTVLANNWGTNMAPWKFIVVSDSQGSNTDSNNGVNRVILGELAVEIINQDVDFVLFPGDLVSGYPAQTLPQRESSLNTWLATMLPVYDANIGVYPVPGNHDIYEPVGTTAWNNVFCGSYALPDNGPAGEVNLTYSVTHKNAFIMGLYQYTTVHQVNQPWVDAQLAANSKPHIFVFGHEPAFRAYHDDCLGVYPAERDAFWASIRDAGGRTYFCGHDHFYNHARVNDGDGDPNNDIHQYISGTAGAPLYDWSGWYLGDNSFYTVENVHYVKQYGYVLCEIDGFDVTLTWMERISAGIYTAMDVFSYTVPEDDAMGDLDRNGVVDVVDLGLLAEDWLEQTSGSFFPG
jgi:hypothetical protein